MKKYNYFGYNDLSIYVSDDTVKYTSGTFLPTGILWENLSIFNFFKDVKLEKSYNIIDIGAQSGLYSLFAKFLTKSNFYAFEPYPLTYNLLVDNLRLNNIQNVETFNIGISNTKEKKILNICDHNNGFNTLGDNVLRFDVFDKIEVNTDTIDNLFYDKNIRVDYIKIDTEGWEYFVLKGAEKTIKKDRPIIQIEWNEENAKQCNVKKIDLEKLLEEYKYSIKHKDDRHEELLLEPY